jgi:hypothetical protein
MAMRASMYLAINIVAISRDDIMCCRNFRHYASGNGRNDRVMAEFLILNFEF